MLEVWGWERGSPLLFSCSSPADYCSHVTFDVETDFYCLSRDCYISPPEPLTVPSQPHRPSRNNHQGAQGFLAGGGRWLDSQSPMSRRYKGWQIGIKIQSHDPQSVSQSKIPSNKNCFLHYSRNLWACLINNILPRSEVNSNLGITISLVLQCQYWQCFMR